MGKSSTVNSVLAETVAQVVVMQGPASRAQAISRTAAGFTLTLIDTPGVLEGDAVDGAVRILAETARYAVPTMMAQRSVPTHLLQRGSSCWQAHVRLRQALTYPA